MPTYFYFLTLYYLRECKENTMEVLVARQKDMGALFLVAYAPLSSEDMAGTRLNLAEVLYYRLLEQIILDEIRKKPHVDLQVWLMTLEEHYGRTGGPVVGLISNLFKHYPVLCSTDFLAKHCHQ